MEARDILRQSPLFADIAEAAIEALAAHARLIDVRSGAQVVARGSMPDHVYIVATGRLRAMLADGRIAGTIPRLWPSGEISAVLGEPHTADVYAIRDSVLVELPTAALLHTMGQFPESMLRLTRLIVQRLRQNAGRQALAAVRQRGTIAVVPATPDMPARQIAERLCRHLGAGARLVCAATVDAELDGACSALREHDDAEAERRLTEYLNALEVQDTQIVYLAERADAWARRCIAQADRVLVVSEAGRVLADEAMLDLLRDSQSRAPVDLLMIRPDGAPAPTVLDWRSRCGAGAHYYLRLDRETDFARLARQLSGRGVGLVLGGGGARGFAHLGLFRALQELGIPVDVTGGSSMGAFLAGLLACGRSVDDIRMIARDTFVTHNYLNDYVLPTISLIRGRKFARHLHEIFGEQMIEELRLPYFCVATNLTRGAAAVRDRGPLYLWIATSMAVPGVAPPVAYNGELYADGAVINSLPTDVMRGLERGPVIASDVSTEGGIAAQGVAGPDPEAVFRLRGEEAPRLLSILFRTATLTSESGVAQRAASADVYLRMPVTRIGMFDWKRMDEIVERGYQHAMQQLQGQREKLFAI
ncbi:patatin-like phospholipase family protein [Solimonas soli]|uniref:patatin-like phospholipase family protein n=1 Tax=Solimonas soli TaxID=413479 RepID=UPI000489B0C9|nr:patatin-like phospholipase family protein [Solimonas soli]